MPCGSSYSGSFGGEGPRYSASRPYNIAVDFPENMNDIVSASNNYSWNSRYGQKEVPYSVRENPVRIEALPPSVLGSTQIRYVWENEEMKPYSTSIAIDPSVIGTPYEASVKTHENVHANEQAEILPYIPEIYREMFAEGDATLVEKANNVRFATNPVYETCEKVVKSIYGVLGEGNINKGRELFYNTINKVKDFKGTLRYFKNKFNENDDAEKLYDSIVNPGTKKDLAPCVPYLPEVPSAAPEIDEPGYNIKIKIAYINEESMRNVQERYQRQLMEESELDDEKKKNEIDKDIEKYRYNISEPENRLERIIKQIEDDIFTPYNEIYKIVNKIRRELFGI